MKKPQRPASASAAVAPFSFAGRPASQAWEKASCPDCPQNQVWVWYKPPTAPLGLILRIPDETYRDAPQLAAQWTMRRLVQAAGVDPVSVSTWFLYGAPYLGMNGANPYFDAAIPQPVAGADPNIVVQIGPPLAAAPIPLVPLAAGPMIVAPMSHVPVNGFPVDVGQQAISAADAQINKESFEHIDADWTASLELEKDLARLRKQLLDLMGRLKSLNRDLSPLERLHASNQEKKDWLQARRCLRDCGTRLWKCIKAHDIGYTSSAGRRKWFEEIYEKQIVPRRPFEGLQQAQRGYEIYRKQVQTLSTEMSNAYSVAQLDGERRAQQVLGRIAEKVRDATSRKNFLGVILDH